MSHPPLPRAAVSPSNEHSGMAEQLPKLDPSHIMRDHISHCLRSAEIVAGCLAVDGLIAYEVLKLSLAEIRILCAAADHARHARIQFEVAAGLACPEDHNVLELSMRVKA